MVKKYKLFSSQGDEKPPCAFFVSEKGCRNGANCKFAHVQANTVIKQGEDDEDDKVQLASTINETGSVVSSESDDEKNIAVVKTPEECPSESGKKRKKTRRGATNDSPFAKPKKVKLTPTTTNTNNANPSLQTGSNQKKADKVKQENPAESTTPSFQSLIVSSSARAPETDKKATAMQGESPNFRALDLPVASFSLDSVSQNAREPIKQRAPDPPPVNKTPLPINTKTGRKWLKLVEKTRQHFKFASEFDYGKYIAADEPLGGESVWVRAKPFGDWCRQNPQAIAIDCEMCETTDPESGKKNSRALCRLSVVDADTDEVLLDTLVKPQWPVSDYRSRINGITKEHLEDVHFTLKHAQEFMLALCSEEAIILGHSVNNDLAALRMEHYCVVDSACLFKASDSEKATVGLKDLSMHILKKAMPTVHDSVNDSRVALRCLEHYLEKDGNVEPVVRTTRKKNTGANQLFVHRIPKNIKTEHLADVFLEHASVAVEDVDEIVFSSDDRGKTHIHFKTRMHANLAFEMLEGTSDADPSGRLQKKLYLRGGGYIRVRKMVKEPEQKKEDKTP